MGVRVESSNPGLFSLTGVGRIRPRPGQCTDKESAGPPPGVAWLLPNAAVPGADVRPEAGHVLTTLAGQRRASTPSGGQRQPRAAKSADRRWVLNGAGPP